MTFYSDVVTVSVETLEKLGNQSQMLSLLVIIVLAICLIVLGGIYAIVLINTHGDDKRFGKHWIVPRNLYDELVAFKKNKPRRMFERDEKIDADIDRLLDDLDEMKTKKKKR